MQLVNRIVFLLRRPTPERTASVRSRAFCLWPQFLAATGGSKWLVIIPQLRSRDHEQALRCLGGSFSAMRLDGENLSAAEAQCRHIVYSDAAGGPRSAAC